MRRRVLLVATVLLLAVALPGALTVGWIRGWGEQRAHYPAIDRDDPVAVGVRDAHVRLNAAVGWGDWRPSHLQGLSASLRRLAARYGGDTRSAARSQLLEAAYAVERARRRDDRWEAIFAHRLIEGLESRFAEDYEERLRSR